MYNKELLEKFEQLKKKYYKKKESVKAGIVYDFNDCYKCYDCNYCYECIICYDCFVCERCICCVGLTSKKFYVLNKEVSEEEFGTIRKNFEVTG